MPEADDRGELNLLEPFHRNDYVDDLVIRLSEQLTSDADCFATASKNADGKHSTYEN